MKTNRNMNQTLILAGLVPFFFGAAFSTAVQVQEGIPLHLGAHEIKVQGTSTVHDWESPVEKVNLEGSALLKEGGLLEVEDFVLKVPVKSIVSGKKKMDNLTYEALNEKAYPVIQYELSELLPAEADMWTAKGILTIAGKSQPLEMAVRISGEGADSVIVTGEPDIDMTKFGIKPPSLMFGAMKVGPDVRIPFSVTLSVTEPSGK